MYGKVKDSFEAKISKLHEEIIEECENYNKKNKFPIIPEEEIPDKVKIKGIIEFFENNAQRLNGIEFTKNKFAICLREGICPQIHEGTNNLNVLYRREQIIYYIISQLLLQVMEQKDIAKLLSSMIKCGVNIYGKYCDLINSINYGYDLNSQLFSRMMNEVSNLEDVKEEEKEEFVLGFQLQMYGQSVGTINAVNDFNQVVKNEMMIGNVENKLKNDTKKEGLINEKSY